ncbi:hypothetical protein ACFVID_26755 [Streptomyces sp. NPDC127132]|uniref:hypothetical protein n=1 Tax=Streptomyces sp. NPDC127132 TaxID=3345374 RepID=UPI003642C493
MRSYAGVMLGNLLLATVWCIPGPVGLVLGAFAWSEGGDWAWIALAAGLACSVPIPFMAAGYARRQFPRITRRDRQKHTDIPYGDATFVLWAPRSPQAHPRARLARADVLEASLVRYSPEGEATYTTYGGTYTPDEFTPLVRLTLRVHGSEETEGAEAAHGAEDADGAWQAGCFAGFEVTDEWRVPSLCLSAVTAGRLAVLVDPPGTSDPTDPSAPGRITPLWPRSTLLAGTRTSRIVDLEGRTTDVTRYPGRLLRHMRISLDAGGVDMAGDLIDLRGLDAATAARYTAVAEWARARPESPAPVTEPGEESRWIVDSLPGERAAFGSVSRRWSRRGGVLVRARFLQMSPTHTFQDHGPVLDTVLRIHPADGTPAFVAARRLTVPLDYLAVLHRTRDVVLYVSPNGTSYVVDWARTNLLAGTAMAEVITPDGLELPLAGRPDAIWALMNLLASHGLSNPTPVLDLRRRRMSAVAGPAMELVRDGTPDALAAPYSSRDRGPGHDRPDRP